MSKYNALWAWIRENGTDSFRMSFDEIGQIAGIPIDHSFLASKKELLDKMYDYGCQDFRLKRIIEKYHATRQDYEDIFDKLFHWANFRKRRRYIPINSFFFVSSLETILKHKDIDSKKLTQKMMNHFHF